jgi:hypothetical protein
MEREQKDIQGHLQDLFGPLTLEERHKDIVVIEESSGAAVEIMHTGSAMRKVFHALVFLFTLASATETRRVFLIEGTHLGLGVKRLTLPIEPEALLHDELQKGFVSQVLFLAQRFRIQVFMTSHSSRVFDFFAPQVPNLCINHFVKCNHEWTVLTGDHGALESPSVRFRSH